MATYSEYQQRMLDQQFNAEMDRRDARKTYNWDHMLVEQFPSGFYIVTAPDSDAAIRTEWPAELRGPYATRQAAANVLGEARASNTRHPMTGKHKPAPVDPKWDPIANEPDNGDRFW